MIRRALIRQSKSLLHGSRSCLSYPRLISTQKAFSTLGNPRIRTRLYSTASESTESSQGTTPDTSDGSKGSNASDTTNTSKNDSVSSEKLAAKDGEIIELKDKYLRSVADFRNLQERTKRDVQSARDFAIQRFAKDLVDSIDNLDRALATVSQDKLKPDDSPARTDLINLYEGLKMTESILMQTLKKHGLERFDPSVESEQFNPNLHDATFQTAVEGKEDGTVFHTQQKGFLLNGRVLRAAKVGIVKNA